MAVLLLAFSTGALIFLKYPPSSQGDSRHVEVPEGATFSEITDLLDREGLITSRFYFLLLGKWLEIESDMQAGEYAFHTAMRPWDLVSTMVQGRVLEHPVVIPEGTTADQIGKILESNGLAQADVFKQIVHDPGVARELGGRSLEGYLFPATYSFSRRASPVEMVRKMLIQFNAHYDKAWTRQAEALGMTQHQVVTLASIIEKETANPEERAIISAVFHNRLRKGMRLQSDPTVIYGLSDFDGDLTRTDLETPSPYNTYVIDGLPPGPISNPGEASLSAALFPAPVDYLFFVSKNDGSHHFSTTLSEHNAAVAQYQRRKA
jgi:UPF0755 protein